MCTFIKNIFFEWKHFYDYSLAGWFNKVSTIVFKCCNIWAFIGFSVLLLQVLLLTLQMIQIHWTYHPTSIWYFLAFFSSQVRRRQASRGLWLFGFRLVGPLSYFSWVTTTRRSNCRKLRLFCQGNSWPNFSWVPTFLRFKLKWLRLSFYKHSRSPLTFGSKQNNNWKTLCVPPALPYFFD